MPGSWSDYLQLRRGSAAPPPSPEDGDVRIYADATGALRSVQSDGTDAAIGGGGGSQPVDAFAYYWAATSAAGGDIQQFLSIAANHQGAVLLDVTDPVNPTLLEDGYYSLQGHIFCDDSHVTGTTYYAEFDATYADASNYFYWNQSGSLDTRSPSTSGEIVCWLPAGTILTAFVFQTDTNPHNFEVAVTVHRRQP